MARVVGKNIDGKILKREDKWREFQGGIINGVINTQLKTPFDHIQQTGRFKLEIEYVYNISNGYTYASLISSGYSSATGVWIFLYDGRIYFYMRSVGVLIAQYYSNVLLERSNCKGRKFHLRFEGDNTTGITMWVNGQKIGGNNLIIHPGDSGISTSTYYMYIGYLVGSTHVWNGYMRNFKVWDEYDNLTYNLPMNDENNCYDLVSGQECLLHSSLIVKDFNNENNYVYFNGDGDSQMYIGDTSTLGFMNSGIFNMKFKIKMFKRASGNRLIWNSLNGSQRGFFIYDYSNYLRFYWCDGTGTYLVNETLVSPCLWGEEYSIEIKGDGDKLYLTSWNEDGSINTTGEFDITYIPNATTTYFTRFNYNKLSEFMLRDFEICSDYEGTIPYLTMPFQDRETLATDITGGLEAFTKKNVGFNSDKTHILRSKDLWGKLGSADEGALGRISVAGTNTKYNFIHQTGVFRIEWEWMFENILTPGYNPYPFASRVYSSSPAEGLYMYKTNGYNNLRVALDNGSGFICNSTISLDGVNGMKQKCILIGDGTQVSLYTGEVGTEPTLKGSLPYVLNPGGGNSMTGGCIGGSSSNWFPGYLRNVKIYSSMDESRLVQHFPLTDNLNPTYELIEGSVKAYTGTIKSVEL